MSTRATASRFIETKRMFQKEYFSPLIETQMNRCVQCLRCVRYCDEVMDVKALAPAGRGTMTEIKAFGAHPLDCEFCGGCVQICPVGAITSRLSMYEYRPWMLKRADTICTILRRRLPDHGADQGQRIDRSQLVLRGRPQ